MNALILLIVGILGAVGFIILLVVGIGLLREERGGKEERQLDEPSQPTRAWSLGALFRRSASQADPSASPTPRAGPPASSREGPTGGTHGAGAHEVLRVMRDDLTGRLFVEMAGRRFQKIGDVQDPDIGQAFLTTLRDLQEFARGASPVHAQPTPAKPAESQAEPRPPTLAAPERPPTPPTPPGPAAPPRTAPTPAARSTGPAAPLPAPSMNPFKQMQVLRDMAKNPPPPPKTITEQIDEILQARLMGTPHDQRGIRVRSAPKGNAVFDVDGTTYEAVDAVPDPEVRAIIRAAIAEWEKAQ